MKVHSIHTTDSNVKCDISSPIRKPATPPKYSRNNMRQKCEGDCGLRVLNEINTKKYLENMKKIVGAVWELPAK